MNQKKIFPISINGGVKNYYHFIFACLIPLINYDINTKHKYSYIIKITIGNLSNILDKIFPNRILTDYIPSNYKLGVGDRQNYFNTYINLKKNKTDDNILLDAFDIFECISIIYLVNNFNEKDLKKLEKQYVDFYYIGDNNIDPDQNNITNQYKKYKNDEEIKKIKTRYTQLYITDKYIKLQNIRPRIINFLNSLTIQLSYFTPPIILIERKIGTEKEINEFVANNYKGQLRIIYNHDELQQTLKNKYGNNFRNVNLENISFYEQYLLFKNAKIIIGQHGAGLTNIFFSQNKKTTLIEICPEWNNGSYCFANLSKFCGINYIAIIQDPMTKNEWSNLFKQNAEDVDENLFKPSLKENLTQALWNLKKIKANLANKKCRPHNETFIKNSGSVNIEEIMHYVEINYKN